MPGASPWGSPSLGADAPGIIATQSTHKQLASFSQASQIHIKDRHIKRPEAPGRASALQRELHAARLDLAVLSAVRLARCRRADDEGPLRRGAVGRHDPARHRTAQEDPRGAPRVRGEGDAPRAPLVLRAVRARPRRDPRRRRAKAACTTSPGRAISTDLLATTPSYWQLAPGRRLARLPGSGGRLCHDRSQQADAADAGLRPRDRRLCRARHPRAGRGAISAREPHRRRKRTTSTRCCSC